MSALTSPANADPNFPPNLSIAPSSRRSHLGTSDVTADAGRDDAAQDIAQYGIAGRTWEAAYLLQQYLAPPPPIPSRARPTFDPPNPLGSDPDSSPAEPRRRVVLEIGSGTGYLSLSIAPHLAATDTLVLTDLENVCPLLDKNLGDARRRWIKDRPDRALPICLVRPLPWGESSFLEHIRQQDLLPDVVLASDLVYFPFLYPPLLRTLLGLTEHGSPTLLFSYKIRSLVREQPFWEAFGRWFEFEAVQIGQLEERGDNEGGKDREQEGDREVQGSASEARQRIVWSRFGAAKRQSCTVDHVNDSDLDELYVFVAHRRAATRGISQLLEGRTTTDEDLMFGRNGLEGEISGGTRFEEMLLNALEWD
ncbi:uncharacterized protein JCM15063_001120 [Sporobolomyces koalae]|uniref:uncharacterized protein n=1 Tax=Sporobolomyces koalae TaxID=500713 RepID=UPI0031771B57